MKHIKKKFQFERLMSEQAVDDLNQFVTPTSRLEMSAIKKIPKDQQALILFDNNKLIQAFHVNNQGKSYLIPEPDPVLIYFHMSYANYTDIAGVKQNLFKVLNNTLTESLTNDLYHYFGLTTGFITFLFTAMEAFINRHIPNEYVYTVKKARNTETYNKDQIQRYLGFEDKLKHVLKETSSKDFTKSYPLKYQHIVNLKEFRDSIVHTKPNLTGSTPFDYLYKKALDFKYELTLLAVRDFMNYYEPNYIQECDCGQDW